MPHCPAQGLAEIGSQHFRSLLNDLRSCLSPKPLENNVSRRVEFTLEPAVPAPLGVHGREACHGGAADDVVGVGSQDRTKGRAARGPRTLGLLQHTKLFNP